MLLGIALTFPDLPFDAFFTLVVWRVAGVNDGIHISSASFKYRIFIRFIMPHFYWYIKTWFYHLYAFFGIKTHFCRWPYQHAAAHWNAVRCLKQLLLDAFHAYWCPCQCWTTTDPDRRAQTQYRQNLLYSWKPPVSGVLKWHWVKLDVFSGVGTTFCEENESSEEHYSEPSCGGGISSFNACKQRSHEECSMWYRCRCHAVKTATDTHAEFSAVPIARGKSRRAAIQISVGCCCLYKNKHLSFDIKDRCVNAIKI